MPTEHSRLSPSSMSRIKKCPGSAVVTEEDNSNAASDRGTLLHSLGERMLKGETVDTSEFPDEESQRSVYEYVDYVRCFRSHGDTAGIDHSSSKLVFEDRIVSKIIPDHGGTIDTLIVSDTHIHVIDYKSGVMPVSARNNDQGLSYLALADEKYPGRSRFFFSIVQPAVFGRPQCQEYTKEQIDTHFMEVIMISTSDEKKAGEHCRWCPLVKNCTVREAHVQKLVQLDFAKATEWDGETCKEILGMASVMATLASEAKKRIQSLLMNKEIVKGWRLAKSLGNRTWKDSAVVESELKEKGVPEDVIYKKKLLSPAQLESFSKAYKPFVMDHCERLDNGVIAVDENSNLPDYIPEDIFDPFNPNGEN